MAKVVILSSFTFLLNSFVYSKIYERCELAKELRDLHEISEEQLATWVCIARHESNYNTSAVNQMSGDHGLLQISQLFWCSPPGEGFACGISCSALVDDDIEDDIVCARRIYREHKLISGDGFNAWIVYGQYCRNKEYVRTFLDGCFDRENNLRNHGSENSTQVNKIEITSGTEQSHRFGTSTIESTQKKPSVDQKNQRSFYQQSRKFEETTNDKSTNYGNRFEYGLGFSTVRPSKSNLNDFNSKLKNLQSNTYKSTSNDLPAINRLASLKTFKSTPKSFKSTSNSFKLTSNSFKSTPMFKSISNVNKSTPTPYKSTQSYSKQTFKPISLKTTLSPFKATFKSSPNTLKSTSNFFKTPTSSPFLLSEGFRFATTRKPNTFSTKGFPRILNKNRDKNFNSRNKQEQFYSLLENENYSFSRKSNGFRLVKN